MIPILYIVIPCYNEQEVLPLTAPGFLKKLQQLEQEGHISDQSRVLFVDDGSKDHTWEIITRLSQEDEHFVGIRQSRNRGHQNAVLAGLMEAKEKCDITISIDCDGQDDINAMDAMVREYENGCDVVYGVRSDRTSDTFFKRFTAESFYRGTIALLSFIGVIWAVISNITGNTVQGWSSTICIVCFMGSIQLLSLGIIGEYVGKTYLESKHRPRYIISERTEKFQDQQNEDTEYDR